MVLSSLTDIPVYSAFYGCKGGADDFCRHIVAILFKVESYLNDRNSQCVTSSQCMWVKRVNPNTCPVPVIDIETNIMEENKPLPIEELYNPIPPSVSIPKPKDILPDHRKAYSKSQHP